MRCLRFAIPMLVSIVALMIFAPPIADGQTTNPSDVKAIREAKVHIVLAAPFIRGDADAK